MERSQCEALDRADPLAPLRERFRVPAGVVYLDGNSLGALPADVPGRLAQAVEREWGEGLITSWNRAGWVDAPRRTGVRIAPLVGARPDEVIATDGVTINLFKLVAGALRLRPERRVIVTDLDNFPTDLYVLQAACDWLGGEHTVRRVARKELEQAIDRDVALVALSHVDYRSAELLDLPLLTRRARDAGALSLWDVSHSAGVLPVELGAAGADLAVGCGYKYLNGGPGAPAFVYVKRELHERFEQPIQGWFGHASPFAFELDYRPGEGVLRALSGTPNVLSLLALESALDVFEGLDMHAVRRKSVALGELFINEVEANCGDASLELASPRRGESRGSHVSFHHEQGYAIVQALIARGVIGDFRPPDLLRFGFGPLYLRYTEVWDAARARADVLATGDWDRPEFHRRNAVT
jgi:kynureninase